MADATLHLPHALGYTAGPQHPELEFGRASLAVHLVAATNPSGATLALCGACNVSHAAARSYGDRVLAALRIVARDADDGSLYSATAVHPEAMPLWLDAPPVDAEAGPEHDEPVRFDGQFFTVDLAAHLRLPPQARRYDVLAWLDGLASALVRGEVPADPARAAASGSTPWVDELAVHPDHGPAEGLRPGLARRAEWPDRLWIGLPAALRGPASSEPLTLLLQGARSRSFAAWSVASSAWRDASAAGGLSVELEALGVRPDPLEVLHAIAIVGGAASLPLRLPAMTR